MGLLRSAGLTVIAILVFLMLLAANSLLTITMSLNYNNLEPELLSVATDIGEDIGLKDDILSRSEEMNEACLNYSEYVYAIDKYVFTIPCDIIVESDDAIYEESMRQLIEDVYYKEYDCGGLFGCSSQGEPGYIVSKMAHDYWKGKFYLALMVTLVLAVLGFLIAEGKKNYPFLLGGLVIIAALPFIKVSWFFSLFGSFEVARMLGVLFSQAFSVFLIMAIVGIVLILLGVAIKFVGLGKFIDKITGGEKRRMKSEVKEEVKKEIKEEKSKKK